MCPTETFFLKGAEVGITANKNLSCGELTSLFCQISIGFISSFSDFRSQDCNKNRKSCQKRLFKNDFNRK
jgi:hypothetical protein